MQSKPSRPSNAVFDRVRSAPQGAVWTPVDFLDLSGREAIDKALQRLVRAGSLRRIGRGLYDSPSFNSLLQQPNPPDPRAVIDAVARRDQIRVLIDGMTAANDLGFTNTVPARIIVHTDARLKTITLGKMAITFRPTAASKLFWAGRPAMRIIQALHWLRDTNDADDQAEVTARLSRILQDPRNGKALRDDINDGMATLPAWMQALLRPMIQTEATAT